jgi:hypothetical protein
MTSRNALVTGASAGLGVEFAKLLAQDGHNLVLTARNQDRLQRLADELQQEHSIRAQVFARDLSQPGAAPALVEALDQAGLTIDILVNNAGFGHSGKYHENPAEQEFALLQVNVVALAQLTRLLLPGMVARGWGRVLNVASTAAFQPGPHMAGYFASKAYVLSLSESLAYELKDTGVSVTVLCPGPTQTEFTERAGIKESLLFRLSAQSAEKVAEIGYQAMLKGEAVVIPGLHNWALAQSMRFVPRGVARAVASWLVK